MSMGLAAAVALGCYAALQPAPFNFAAAADAVAVRAGFTFARIEIGGHRYTAEREIATALAIERGTPLHRLDLGAAGARIEQLPWVKTAVVQRVLPDGLKIAITERKPAALWRMPDGDRLIDIEGRVLADVSRGTDVGLPILSGAGAGSAASGILPSLASYGEITGRLVEAERIANRRWTLLLAGGTRVHLPADGSDAALAWLVSRTAAGLLDAGLTAIDLRVHGQLVVRRAADPEPRTALAPSNRVRE